MKITLAITLFFLNITMFGQSDFGIGLVSIRFNEKTILDFYSSPMDKKPIEIIRFFNDRANDSWNIKDLNKHQKWLKPEVLWLDYDYFIFRCKSENKEWFEVVANNDTKKTYWIKKSKSTKFSKWEAYLKEMFSISRKSSIKQPIRKSPDHKSEEIKYNEEDCFQVKSMKGDWIEIFTTDFCDEDPKKNPVKIKSGWIKWRQNNTLLIDCYLTS